MNYIKIKDWILKIAIFIGIAFSTAAYAGEFTCPSGKSHCQYRGKITQVYINTQIPLFLVYVDATLSVEDAANNGIAISSNRTAIAIDDSNLEVAKMALSTLQVAYVANKDVVIDMRGTLNDFPKIFRFWSR